MSAVVRSIAHFDLDTFFVSVERLKNSALKNIPVAVGGSSDRGVIASCSYEARKFGVHSAMPVKMAKRLCPELKIIKGDFDSYSKYSRQVTDIITQKVPVIEKASIDEFYVDFTGMDRYFGCSLYTRELCTTVEKETGLDISYALASNKLVSKVATNEAKPHGWLEVVGGQEKNFLSPLRVQKLPMVGEKTGKLLYDMGIKTVGTLSQIPQEMMINLLGKNGAELWRRANGIDDTPVIPYQESVSVGTENTFERDTTDVQFLHRELARMTESIAFELRETNRLAGCVTVKLRYSDFQTYTKQTTITYSAADYDLIKTARELFDKLYERRLLVRLIGVRFSHLVPGTYQIDLFKDTQEMVNLHKSIDSIKHDFGEAFLVRGCGFDPGRAKRKSVDKPFRPFQK